ncbi:neuronal acetylcholine receptor subunit alpha-7-like precursor [Aplysia californica]|uniref:Neuronal acetylcholine receptor subunit alpha-7-like precursor n=1 Tax=Aplysia californica TaxID=6500 RepID=M4VN01_APLCA|nr:neuronal acetylcholine receptor subunit alpha-7-like precursor [Aplysia californica]AGI03854.1 nicotinic acetylcholine receptor subunit type N [Aplysia californica]
MLIKAAIVLALHVTTAVAGNVGAAQAQLLGDLFTTYEKDVRPICDTDVALDVYVGLAIRQIIELDEPKQILYVNAWVRLRWFDCHLQWNASDYKDIDNLIVPFNKVWIPDITLYDNAGDGLEGSKDYLVSVSNTGVCRYLYPTVIRVLCKIDVTYFPFDTQACPLKFGSWSHNGFELNVVNSSNAGDISSFVENTEWDMLSLPVKHNIEYYKCCPEPYPDVTFTVTIKRKPMFYVLNLLFPCVLITAVALLGFLLPPDAGEKVSLEITVLLSLAVFLLVVSETLPASSENFPYIGVYFAVSMVLVSMSTLLTVLILNLHYKGNLNRPVPNWMRTVVFHWLGRVMLVERDSCTIFPESYSEVKAPNKNGASNEAFQGETYSNGYQGFNGKNHIHSSNNGGIPLGEEFSEETTSPTPDHRPHRITPITPLSGEVPASFAPFAEVLKQQLAIMEKEDARKESKLRHDHLASEWKKVGIIMDRFFLAIFAIVLFISSVVILVQLGAS